MIDPKTMTEEQLIQAADACAVTPDMFFLPAAREFIPGIVHHAIELRAGNTELQVEKARLIERVDATDSSRHEWMRKFQAAQGLASDLVQTDGQHHKQWYVTEILKELLSNENFTELIDDGWDLGVAP